MPSTVPPGRDLSGSRISTQALRAWLLSGLSLRDKNQLQNLSDVVASGSNYQSNVTRPLLNSES